MGRINPQREGGPRRRWAPAGMILLGILALIAVSLGSYELGRRASSPPRAALSSSAAAPAAPAAQAFPPAIQPGKTAAAAPIVPRPPDAGLVSFARASPSPVQEKAEPPAPPTQPPPTEVPVLAETPREKMARCLSFVVENDEIHYDGYSPLATPVKVTATNRCAFSFEGPDVSVEVLAIPRYGVGTMARAVGRFQDPIPSSGRSETQMLLACPRCDEVTHHYEARLAP